MAIENRNLEIGTKLVASYEKVQYVCTVEAAADGEGVVYALEDGKKFKSPSAAGSSVMGGNAVNGWRFWSLEGEATTAAGTSATKATRMRTKADSVPVVAKPKRKTKPKPAFKLIKVHDDQTDVPQGCIRVICYACDPMVQIVEGDTVPSVCPAGHRIDDTELTGDTSVPVEAEAGVE